MVGPLSKLLKFIEILQKLVFPNQYTEPVLSKLNLNTYVWWQSQRLKRMSFLTCPVFFFTKPTQYPERLLIPGNKNTSKMEDSFLLEINSKICKMQGFILAVQEFTIIQKIVFILPVPTTCMLSGRFQRANGVYFVVSVLYTVFQLTKT